MSCSHDMNICTYVENNSEYKKKYNVLNNFLVLKTIYWKYQIRMTICHENSSDVDKCVLFQ